jgi:glycine hydroxymethyltransferase
MGMKEKEMKKVGQYLAAIILNKSSKEKIKKQVAELRHNFQKIHYCFH